MLDVLHLVVFSTLLVRNVEPIRCHRCTSLVQQECEHIYMFFTTYGFVNTELEAECPKKYNACVAYVFASDTYNTDSLSIKFYIQRGCGILPKEQECESIEVNLGILNVTVFDKITNCHVCNTSLCNNMPIEHATDWLMDEATLRRPFQLISIAVVLIVHNL